jgi:hypothetical protein
MASTFEEQKLPGFTTKGMTHLCGPELSACIHSGSYSDHISMYIMGVYFVVHSLSKTTNIKQAQAEFAPSHGPFHIYTLSTPKPQEQVAIE